MNRIHILAGGPMHSPEYHLSQLRHADEVICADGGANHLMTLDIDPDYIIGDLDSITNNAHTHYKKITKTTIIHDPNQDKTDLELALQLALSHQPTSLFIHCAIGQRIDHTLANLYTLLQIPLEIPCTLVDELNIIQLIRANHTLETEPGTTISIIPITRLKGLRTKGLKWDLEDIDTSIGWFGVSNIVETKPAAISLEAGAYLLVTLSKKNFKRNDSSC